MTREVMALPIAEIAIADRIGFFDAAHAAYLGERIATEGQHDPIHVRRNGNAAKLPWTLVAGLHRLRGASGAGLPTIEAVQVADAGSSIDDLRRLELSENLDHRQRRPIERAIFMVERAQLEEAIDHPGHVGERSQDRALRVRHSATLTVREATSLTVRDVDWRSRTAAAMGCSVQTLERYQRLHRAIVEALPDLAERLNFHPLGDSLSAMTRLAGIRRDDARRSAVEAVLSRSDWKSLDEALFASGITGNKGFRVDPEKLGVVMMDAWGKMPLAGRRAHVEWLVENITPGMAVDMVAGFRKRGLLP